VFEEVGEQTLTHLGSTYPRLDFARRAEQLLLTELYRMIQDALVLAEAEAGLSPQQQQGLFGALQRIRENIISQYGGSEPVAEQQIREQGYEGGIDELLERERQKLLIRKYQEEKLFPKIDVNRREVERYYHTHAEQFNPPAQITVSVLIASSVAAADQVDALLADGKTFEVADAIDGARLRHFEFEGSLDQFDALMSDSVNQKVRRLSPGERTDRTETQAGHIWARLDTLEPGEGRTLQEVYQEIENKLRATKFNRLSRKYVDELMEKGNFTPIDQMMLVLMEVALNRYAQVD
jgi:hypothetical protein